jgi:hypothetical protein
MKNDLYAYILFYTMVLTYKQNKYGGYILFEFIEEETMYEIVLNSKSDFAKTFEKDFYPLLYKLRNKYQLINVNNDIDNDICDASLQLSEQLLKMIHDANISLNEGEFYDINIGGVINTLYYFFIF